MASTEKPKRATRRERLDAAFRVRAGAIGLLTCCTCEYPITPAQTASGHAETCQAHAWTLGALAREGNGHYALIWIRSGQLPPTTTKRTRRTK